MEFEWRYYFCLLSRLFIAAIHDGFVAKTHTGVMIKIKLSGVPLFMTMPKNCEKLYTNTMNSMIPVYANIPLEEAWSHANITHFRLISLLTVI